ncbi:ABC transporter ATP-binding protein [Aquamicrobium sp. LC103]|uniref:ABC transporter ATP-binding protein n=1 Tax=Aquamicrobium sp. LC103 TaxID=1120658 RepID=UPI00063E8806|nr:ABC transporter ATP-binding protein [Aquamicrobium sp. LC103]TKT80236.1 ABC transporter ATP-binding protein [Aquamicrobium sp. LC103]
MSLVAERVSVELAGRRIVEDASFSLARGEVVGLLGPNGAGKSTLMRAIAGHLPHSGSASLDGADLATLSALERARLVAHLPQARVIAWPLSVRNVVGLGRMPWRSFARGFSENDRAICAEAMELMDVGDLADRPATELSGGEQARVLIARAVAQDTPVLIADEPASGLDPAHQMTMMAALRRLATKDRAILVSLHDLTLAARWCDRVVLMRDGRIAADGPPAAILTPECLQSVFGIVAHIDHDRGGMILAPTGLTGDTPP